MGKWSEKKTFQNWLKNVKRFWFAIALHNLEWFLENEENPLFRKCYTLYYQDALYRWENLIS